MYVALLLLGAVQHVPPKQTELVPHEGYEDAQAPLPLEGITGTKTLAVRSCPLKPFTEAHGGGAR